MKRRRSYFRMQPGINQQTGAASAHMTLPTQPPSFIRELTTSHQCHHHRLRPAARDQENNTSTNAPRSKRGEPYRFKERAQDVCRRFVHSAVRVILQIFNH